MTSLELVKKLAKHGANINARMTKTREYRSDQPEYAWARRRFCWPPERQTRN